MRSIPQWLGLLAATLGLLTASRPASAADASPLAKGPIEKIDPAAHLLVVNTKQGSRTFRLTEHTYVFRGKQKITAEDLRTGEVIALRFVTDSHNELLVQRIKAAPNTPVEPAPPPPAPSR